MSCNLKTVSDSSKLFLIKVSIILLLLIDQVPRTGSLLTYSGSDDLPSPVVLLDSEKGSAVSLKTRERLVVRGVSVCVCEECEGVRSVN